MDIAEEEIEENGKESKPKSLSRLKVLTNLIIPLINRLRTNATKKVIIAICIYMAMVSSIFFWLSKNGEDTKQRLAVMIPYNETFIREGIAIASSDKGPESLETAWSFTPGVTNDTTTIKTPSQPSWRKNALTPDGFTETEKPLIALIIRDMGLSDKRTERAIIDIPSSVTFSFSPYTERLDFWFKQSRNTGHETLISIPMEPLTYPDEDPGYKSLLTRHSTQKNIENLKWILEQAEGYVGVTNFMGSQFTKDRRKLEPILRELSKKEFIFFEQIETPYSVVKNTAKNTNLPYLKMDNLIDQIATPYKIQEQLKELEAIAKEKGYAIGVASTYPVTYTAINDWYKTLSEKNISLVPITTVMEKVLARNNKI